LPTNTFCQNVLPDHFSCLQNSISRNVCIMFREVKLGVLRMAGTNRTKAEKWQSRPRAVVYKVVAEFVTVRAKRPPPPWMTTDHVKWRPVRLEKHPTTSQVNCLSHSHWVLKLPATSNNQHNLECLPLHFRKSTVPHTLRLVTHPLAMRIRSLRQFN
jgi:hypothetical protein